MTAFRKKEDTEMNKSSSFKPARPEWRNSNSICALADWERHLGHILKIGGRWHAFDATRFNDDLNGFRVLGSFAGMNAAKEAVEQCGSIDSRVFAGAA